MRSIRRQAPSAPQGTKSRRLIGIAVFFGVLVASVGGIWAARSLLREDPEPWLNEARDELTALLDEQEPERRTSRARRAETLLRQYIDAEGSRPDSARVLLASALFVLDKPDEGERLLGEYDAARVSTPDLERTATIAFRTGRFGLSDRLIGEALSRDDHREPTLRTAVEIRYDLGRDDDVIAHVEELRMLAPDDPRPLMALVLVYDDRGDWDHVVDACREYLRIDPQADMVRMRLVDALITLGTTDEARREFDRLMSDAPELAAQSPLLEARLLNLEGENERALSLADSLLQADPENVESHLLRGRILLAKGDYPSAVAALEETTRLDPASFEAHYLLGQAYGRRGETEKARHELGVHQKLLNARVAIHRLERRASRDPADVEVRRELSQRYREIGVLELATYWEQAAASAEALVGTP